MGARVKYVGGSYVSIKLEYNDDAGSLQTHQDFYRFS